MCVTEHVLPAAFSASLGARNGVAANTYTFELRTLSSKTGNYGNDMINECKKVGMKPVCDHPSYCKNDANSLYIGQTYGISDARQRKVASYFPSGFGPGCCLL